jgi:haloacetate dehalogenase
MGVREGRYGFAWAGDVRGRAIDCGHYLAEEAPDDVYAELHSFFEEWWK